jgi:uncharacterized protein YbjT (DUF2867 family)
VAGLLAETPPNADFILTGPRTLSYAEAAGAISRASGRTIIHVPRSAEAIAAGFVSRGQPPVAAQLLAAMDLMIAAGGEDRVTDAVTRLTGRPPLDFEGFAAANAGVWT